MTSTAGTGYVAARERAAFLDRSGRVRLEFSGAQAAATLNGLVTSDVLALQPGGGQYAAALTAKGKVIADLRVLARADSFLVDVDAAAAPGLLAMLKKFVNPRFAKYRDASAETCDVGAFGPSAAGMVARLAGVDDRALAALPPFAHVTGAHAGQPVLVVRTPELGVPGYELVAGADSAGALADALRAAGAAPLEATDADVLRVEAGWPRYGADFDESQLAQEVGFERLGAISFNKGCYTGQETVIRVQHRGHVNRTLRGLRSGAPLASGAELHDEDGKPVGGVRSAVVSPKFGPIALAYVRREIADGGTVRAGGQPATVVSLPFA